jgi:hypothetical protein
VLAKLFWPWATHKVFADRYSSSVVNKALLTIGLIAMIAVAGCAGLPGSGQQDPGNGVNIEDNSSGATNVTQAVSVEVDDTGAGQEFTEIGATYPRDNFVVRAAQHDQIVLGIDSDGDGDVEHRFNESHISGVNNNAYSFDITLDTGYTLESGDVVMIEYPGIDNPSEPGEYIVEVRLNDRQTTNSTVTIQ